MVCRIYNNYARTKIRYQLGISVQYTRQDNKDLTGNFGDLLQRVSNIFPRANLVSTISRSKSVSFGYQGSSRQPTLRELQPVPDYTNPLLVQQGNPNLKQEFSHNLSMGMNFFQFAKFRTLMVQANVSTVTNRIVNANTVNAIGVQELQYVNVDGNYTMNGGLSYSFPLGNEKNGNGKLDSRLQYGKDISLLNGLRNERVSISWAQQASLNYNVKEKLFAELSAGVEVGKSRYSLSPDMSASFINQFWVADLSYVFPADITLASIFNLHIKGKQGSLPGNTLSMWNASLSKKLFARKAVELKFSVFDLLNSNNSFSQVVGENFIETNKADVLKRIWMVGVEWGFNKFL